MLNFSVINKTKNNQSSIPFKSKIPKAGTILKVADKDLFVSVPKGEIYTIKNGFMVFLEDDIKTVKEVLKLDKKA